MSPRARILRSPRGVGPARRGWTLAAVLLGLVLMAPLALAATLTATVDRTKVSMGETFTLILSLSEGDSTRPPDLSGLSADFDIVDRRRGSRPALVDGKRVLVNDWVLTLAPRRTGSLTIPPLSVSGATSPAIRIEATNPPPAPKGEVKPLFVEVDVAPGAVYAQGEVQVQVRVYDSIGMRSGSISQIKAEGASFRESGEQDSYQKTIGKTRYRVVQQTYVMTPQRSGTIEIEPVELKANIPVPVDGPMPSEMSRLLGRSNVPMPWLDGAMTRGQDVTLKSQPVKVEVLPRPASAQGWFLPARKVVLSEDWSPALAKARVGETLTRTLTLEAVGASPNQLPPLDTPDVPGLRQYQEDSRTETSMIAGEPGAALVKTMAVVPTQPGRFTLPAIRVGWWNTQTQTQDYAELPAVTFTVAPAAGAAPAPAPAANQISTPSAGERTPQDAPEEPAPVPSGPSWGDWAGALVAQASGEARALLNALDLEERGWMAGAAAGGALALLLLLVAVRRRRARPALLPRAREPAPRIAFAPAPVLDARTAERDLRRACKANDPRAAHTAFISWQRAQAPAPLAPLRETPHAPAFAAALEDLRAHLYGSARGGWQGARFLSAWKDETARARRAARPIRGARLAPLYPEA